MEWKFDRCPFDSIDRLVFYWIRAYKFYKVSLLPNNGGWLEQTNKFLQAIDFIDNIVKRENKDG